MLLIKKNFGSIFLGWPSAKSHSRDWDVTRFPVVSKNEILLGVDELNGRHGMSDYTLSPACFSDPE